MKAIIIVIIIFPSILFRCVSARNHTVGGLCGWDFNSDLQDWSNSITFHAEDNLVFKYGPMHDVLEVNRADFRRCRTINPIITHNDGNAVVPLTESGRTRYFICGRRGHCAMGLRLRVPIVSLHESAPLLLQPTAIPPPRPMALPSSPQPGGGSGEERPPRPQTPPPRNDSHSPPSPSDERKVEPPPVVEGPEVLPQLPRSASSSSAVDGGFMIMMLIWRLSLFLG